MVTRSPTPAASHWQGRPLTTQSVGLPANNPSTRNANRTDPPGGISWVPSCGTNVTTEPVCWKRAPATAETCAFVPTDMLTIHPTAVVPLTFDTITWPT